MEIIKKEKIIKQEVIEYKAIDGTYFRDKDECQRYEKSAEVVLLSKLKDIQINEISCEDLFESSGEGIYRVIIPTLSEHIDILNQLWILYGGRCKEDLLFNNSDINTIILVGIRFLDSSKIDWIWFYKFDEEIKKITLGRYEIMCN